MCSCVRVCVCVGVSTYKLQLQPRPKYLKFIKKDASKSWHEGEEPFYNGWIDR